MGMSSHVSGFVPVDETWKKMKEVYDACNAAGVKIPEDVDEFFDWCAPDESGVSIDIDAFVKEVQPYDSADGYEVDIKSLIEKFPHIKSIRFVNSW